MNYKLGDTVLIKKTNETKTILDFEEINGEKIYYMSDNTSYHISQITYITTQSKHELIQEICNNKSFIDKISEDYSKEMANKTIKWFRY